MNRRRRQPPPEQPPTLRDDGAHAAEYAKHAHTEWFTEWWYFNIRDPKTGVALLTMYAVSPYAGVGTFGAMVFPPGGKPPIDTMDPYPMSQVETTPERADVRIGPSRVEVIDADTYRIVGQARPKDDEPLVKWDLTLRRVQGAGPAWLLRNAQGPLDWEDGWWMTWMPFARASGTVTIGKDEHKLEDAAAYHDHNWGIWLSPARNWQWLECSSVAEGVALDLGYSDGFDPPRVALLQLGGRSYEFQWGGIDLPTYDDFKYWPDTHWKYPERARTAMIDREGKLRIEVEWAAIDGETKPLWTGIVLFESHVRVKIRASEREGDGWRQVGSYTMDGIAEWSDSYVDEWQSGEGMVGGYQAEATVFGGGISGLTVAHELADRGFVVTVVEPEEALDAKGVRAMALGGMARSHYARVPRVGPALASRPAGRPTPDSRHDRWRERRVAFESDAWKVPERQERAIDEAARAFRETYVEQGYRLRVVGRASPLEKEPRALGARRAEAVRHRLVERGVSLECIVATQELGDAPVAEIALEDYVLPGEHGFRFFPSYYRHVTDTMSRIPVYDLDGRRTDRRVLDNLKPTKEHLTLRSGQRPSLGPLGPQTVLQMLRSGLSMFCHNEYDPRDFLQLAIRCARFLASCPERREPLEEMSWWNYLCGYCPATQCYLYRYSDAFSIDAPNMGRVLAAFDWRNGDARTNATTFVQLAGVAPGTSPSPFDGYLNGPTTEAWFAHWRRFLVERGVRFVSGRLERLEVERVDGKDVVVPWVRHDGRREPEPWRRHRTREPHYVVVATDAPSAEHASKPLPKVGVPEGLVGYTSSFDGRHRDPYTDPGIQPWDRFQTLSGIQYYFDQTFAIGDGAYSTDAPWALCSVSMQRIWGRVPVRNIDGFAGLVSIDIGAFKIPAGPSQATAWDSSKERIGEQVWMQLSNDLRTAPLGHSPTRIPRPTWFHLDDNLEFGDRGGKKDVVVRNATPYLVPIKGDWKNRPGPSPFDPNVPAATSAPAHPQSGVWTAPHGGYPVHWDSLVYAGIYLKTFTRMTTMESANESARHAVNAILDHYNAHHGTTVPPPDPPARHHPDPTKLSADEVPVEYIGDYCGIWNLERYEPSSFDQLKGIDQILIDFGLPHLFDILMVELIPSIWSHLFPYRGDSSPWGEVPPPPDPKPAWWCPPFVGAPIGKAYGKVRSLFATRRVKKGARP